MAASLPYAWYKLPSVPAQHALTNDEALVLAGFRQVGRTIRKTFKHFRRSLFPFMVALTMGEAFAFSLTTIAPVYLASYLGFDATQIGIFFIIAQVGLIAGSQLSVVWLKFTDPKVSWWTSMLGLSLLAIIGAFALNRNTGYGTYVWGLSTGVFLGWHYCSQRTTFSLCLPKGQDAEMSGFFQYCSIILSWLPPLLFSTLVQTNIGENYALAALSLFGFVTVVLLWFMPSWQNMISDVSKFDETNLHGEGAGENEGANPNEKTITSSLVRLSPEIEV